KIEIYSDIGQIYLEKGEFENAIPYYDKALEINPKYTEAYSRLGYIKYKLGDLSSALQYFGYVIEIDSNFGEAYIGLAHVYQAQKDFYSAIRNYEKSLDIDKDCIEAYHNLGLIYIYKGEFKKALNYLREAIKLNLKLIQVYDELVERIRSESKYNPSEEDLKKYLCTYSIKKEDFPVLAQIINNIERSYKGEFIYSEKISSEVEISDSESVNICINCENLNRRNANFCRTCGVEFMSGDEINRSLVDEFIQLILKEDEERLCCKDSLTTEELFKIVEPIISRISIIREIDGSKEQSSPEEEEFFYLCPNCEFLNRLNVRFCKKCGVEFEMEEGDEEPEVIQEIKEKEIITDKEINKMLEKSRKGNVENGQIVVVDEGTEELVEIDKKEEKEYFIELSVKDKDIKKEESREEKIQKELITEEICEEVI
ncbi:MAG TPA: tetratricopeptide repeat protein, partial [Candidatus Eremiobacteraeota bacterium]|nr:tetratricopeptide repeat protein [Candidatus Eremiobacteraeota bacterium]